MKGISGYALAVVLMMGAGSAAATPMVTGSNREVSVSSNLEGTFGLGSVGPVFGPSAFDYDATHDFTTASGLVHTYATEHSLIDGAGGVFSGMGEAFVDFNATSDTGIHSDSLYDIYFDLDSDYNYTLDVSLDRLMDGGVAGAQFLLDGPTSLYYTTPGTYSSSGVMHAGTYHLLATANVFTLQPPDPYTYYGGHAQYDFALRLSSSVPEPSTMLLLAFGVAGIGLSRRRG